MLLESNCNIDERGAAWLWRNSIMSLELNLCFLESLFILIGANGWIFWLLNFPLETALVLWCDDLRCKNSGFCFDVAVLIIFGSWYLHSFVLRIVNKHSLLTSSLWDTQDFVLWHVVVFTRWWTFVQFCPLYDFIVERYFLAFQKLHLSGMSVLSCINLIKFPILDLHEGRLTIHLLR